MPLRLIASYVVGSGAEAVWIALSLHASSTSKYASRTVVLKAAIQTMYSALACRSARPRERNAPTAARRRSRTGP